MHFIFALYVFSVAYDNYLVSNKGKEREGIKLRVPCCLSITPSLPCSYILDEK